MSPDGALRVGNASGFYGDRYDAVREMLEDGPLDVLTGDYLAELTMLILGRDRLKDPSRGYAKTFLRQMRDNLRLAEDRGVTVVANAGGLNPAGLADALRELAADQDLDVRIAHVEGDDLRDRADELGFGGALTANAYLGGWGIAACLDAGAEVVVTGRVTDASVVVGPAAWRFGWARDDWDRLAGAVAAGHVIECGAQATGGNYAFFTEHDVTRPGFPIAEVAPDGSSVITKHPGTGGAVTVGTVTAQLLYEIAGARYPNPDVTARFDTVELTPDGEDRVRLSGTRGEPPPPTLKVACNRLGGFRNEVTFVLTGLDIEAKAELVRRQVEDALASRRPAEIEWTLARTDAADAPTEQQASALLRCQVRDSDPEVVGRAFSSAAIELALASYPGFHVTAPPSSGSPYGVYTAAYVDRQAVPHVAVGPDGARIEVGNGWGAAGAGGPGGAGGEAGAGGSSGAGGGASAGATRELEPVPPPSLPPAPPSGETLAVPLGRVFGARSGDKGGAANLGVWARDDAGWRWLAHELTVDRVRKLLPETADLPVERHLFPNLRAVNLVIDGLLGEGVASSTRFDPQAKGLGEWLRARVVELPAPIVGDGPG